MASGHHRHRRGADLRTGAFDAVGEGGGAGHGGAVDREVPAKICLDQNANRVTAQRCGQLAGAGADPGLESQGARPRSRTDTAFRDRPAGRRERGHTKQSTLDKRKPIPRWPITLRHIRAWLTPATLLQRYWRAWSNAPPPPQLQDLLTAALAGQAIPVYIPP